jgi:phage-related protein
VTDFIDSLSDKHATAVVLEMTKVRREGLPAARHLTGEIWEVRVSTQDARLRVLFAQEGKRGRVLLALAGFQKQTQTTPRAAIDLAQQRLNDWRRRGTARPLGHARRGLDR